MQDMNIFFSWAFENLEQIAILVLFSIIIITEIQIILFPEKTRISSDSIFLKPFFIFASLFKNHIAKRLLKKKILKDLKVPVVTFSNRLSFDKFLKEYKNIFIDSEEITKSVQKQISQEKKRFIFMGDGGTGKTLTAYKMIDALQKECYIPVIYKSTFDKDKILESSISLETQTAKLLQNISYKKFIFIFDNFDMETFTNASDICQSEFSESLFILTTRNASLKNDYNFNNVDKEILLRSFLLTHQKIESTFSIPLYLAILKKYTFKDYKTKNEILQQYIEEQNLSLKRRLKINDPMQEDFYQLLTYIYKATALMAVKSIPLKNDENFKKQITETLNHFESENRFEFIYQNLGFNELEFFNEIKKSSILYEEKGEFKFIHDLIAEYFQRLVANDMLENIDTSDNKEKLNFIIKLDNNNKKAYEKLGRIYEKEKDYQKAVDCYYKSDNYLKIEKLYLLNKVKLSASNWFSLAFLFQQDYLYNKAIEAYQKAIEINPKHANIYSNMGAAHNAKQEFDKAIEAYLKAIEINPQHADAYSNMGLVYSNAKQEYDKAIEAYLKAIEINPQHTSAYYNIGVTYNAKQEYDKAIEAYLKAIEINPQHASAYSNMGAAHNAKQAFDKAIEAYLKAIEINPQHADAYSNMGAAHNAKQEFDKAIEAYLKAIEINPQHANAYSNMGLVYNNAKQEYDKAIEAYLKAIEINPQHANAYSNMGSAYNAKQEFDKAIEAFQKAIEINPQHANTYSNMGSAYNAKQKFNKAIEAYLKAIAIDENHIKAYQNLISVYTTLNQAQNAQFYQQALDKVIEKMKEKEKS